MSTDTPLPPVPPEPTLPTQSAHPGRASARTFVQNVLGWLLGAGIVIGAVALILQDELAAWLPPQAVAVIATIAAIATTVATIAARIMAIPSVDAWLASHASGLATRPKS